MLSIKVALATGAIVVTTISGAYAAGVVNKNGHKVNDHAARGQAVAAAARAEHGRPLDRSGPRGPVTSPTPAMTPSTAPAEKGEHGQRNGRVRAHRHYGHQWGRGHGSGAVVKPDNPNQPDEAQHGHGMNRTR